ncbi:hypothetical protein NDA11_003732 [Ustilago hordei]|uniref:Reverse transcriptase Ty1/copia-type domain-containing protein n=1 Tax=Ustilago hordei TaxID=120017 RepID=I2G2D8_USTHO|nr:hypothetical protein NDA10_003643 [Ustilago hordei]KAJ1584859.1 hypothetical protein NDA15_000241 [Ustilago hordei]KAJ1588137.1 hypothetical protein NDA12_004218 [Ustilago hordei]KAJ1592977.1 hypothetical protein NDA11_003732 [Ustilago hordei]KAJ1601686.1 hypothetical protein NDA14_005338 [Ustilago hordei]
MVSLLQMLNSHTSMDIYDNISVLGLTHAETLTQHSFLAFAVKCSGTQAPTPMDNHLDHMAFAVTVMNSTVFIASGQQMYSADGILLKPLSLNEAKMHDNWDRWKEAMISKMASMKKMNVFELVDTPTDSKLIGVCWVFKLKLDAQYRLHVIQLDISTAFLNGKIDKDVFVRIPPTFEMEETNGKCYRLRKALYGLKQAGRLWHAALDEQLQAFGFQHCQSEPCVYTQGSCDAMRGYIEGILVKFGMSEAWAASTPATEVINTLKPWEGDPANTEEVRYYASLIGSLLWIAQGSRPDIAFAVGRCARFVANPSGEHLVAAKHILRYLKGTSMVSLSAMTQTGGQMLMGWADSDWAGSHDCRRSTSGYMFIIDGLVCSWSSQLQPTVANSSVEAEYVALAAVARELLWTSMFLCELEQPMLKATEVHVSAETSVLHSCDWDLIFK